MVVLFALTFLTLCHAHALTLPSRPHPGRDCSNGPQSRGCWRGKDFDIFTDYDQNVPPGRLREYELTVTEQTWAPDGYLFNGTVFNGQYPGPLIEADWGDTLRITVHNNLTNYNGTSVHWHGIRMLETNWQDGVPGVTQCPIKPGSSQTYEFRAMQYGTSWYHSHFSLQYSNGLHGPLVIHGPSSANWDVDLGPWLITDWYHEDAFKLYYYEIFTPRAAPPQSMLLNGHGKFNCTPAANDTRCTGDSKLFETVFQHGTKYKIGIAHTGTLRTQTFWIDGHNFTVISADFVPIKPYVTNVITLGIGQRYEIIVEANADLSTSNGTDFWIHSQYCALPGVLDDRLGIIRYDARSTRDPYSPPPAYYDLGCADPELDDLVPVVPRQVGNRVNGLEPSDYLKMGLEGWPNASDPDSRIHKWVLRNVPMYLNWSEPSVAKLLTLDKDEGEQSEVKGKDKHNTTSPQFSDLFPAETEPILLDYPTGEWVYFVITNNYTLTPTDPWPPRTLPQSVHPIHLHGHDLLVLAQGEGPFDPATVVPRLDNPPRRDVVNCPLNGFVWIAFRIDNPGAWLMHCHIAWHASDGLAVQFVEQPGKLRGLMERAGVVGGFGERCKEWDEYYTTVNEAVGAVQEDSGV
ncbi:putative extracellular dihydrogeodin oxidase/laccase [Chaetomium sp. MPI-SDFR-AT-0129]|nr:putative extracellular dihydrogeodin oxidase/laccase [Chaetomium sp. MPI-SDFR-AT-0129]